MGVDRQRRAEPGRGGRPGEAHGRVSRRRAESWTSDDDTLTTTTHTADELTRRTAHKIRESAYGDGLDSLDIWDAPNDASSIGYRIPRQRPTEGESNLLLRVGNTGTTTTTFTHTDVTEGIRHV